tara:strand:- start:223 stop:1617 length:1395 start_codon:yes stop_codon:yes gene_type:complete
MTDVFQKIITGNDLKNGSLVVSVNKFGTITKHIINPKINNDDTITTQSGLLDTRFDDVKYYIARTIAAVQAAFEEWSQKGGDIDGEAAGDQSGWSVSLSGNGNIVAIGANKNDGTGTDAGHVRVYEYSGSSWSQKGGDIDGEAADDRSGYSISLSNDGSILAIGARFNDGTGSNAGHTRVYEYSGSAWVQRGSDIDAEAVSDQSGYSVSLSSDGSIVAIGAIFNDGAASNAGHTRVYEWNGSAWIQKGGDIDGEGSNDYSGYSVSLSDDGDIVAIGAIFADAASSIVGHVRVYEYNGSAWVQKGSDIDGEASGDQFGRSVSLSSDGSILAIGSHYYDDGTGANAGYVQVYEYSGSSWSQKGSDIDGEAEFDESGWSVSLSSDGSIVAVGAIKNDGAGSNAGHVRVHEWNGSAWVQKGSDIDGEAASDYSGHSVSLSNDGRTVAIGAIYNDGTASNAGHVRVYAG